MVDVLAYSARDWLALQSLVRRLVVRPVRTSAMLNVRNTGLSKEQRNGRRTATG
jgi:hypothetical protein